MGGAEPLGVGGSRLRTTIVLLAATILPLLIYALISIGLGFRDERRAAEAATIARAERISAAVDARLEAVAATMRALATIRALPERNWSEARARASEIARLDPDWRNVTLTETATDRTVLDLSGSGQAARPRGGAAQQAQLPNGRPTFSGVIRSASNKLGIEASLPILSGSYLLRVELDPMLVQRILVASAPLEGVSAVVDRRGAFIARTKAWPARLGTPATRYVRDALGHGPSGIYPGVTYEGLENYTAFAASPRTGWSAHVAVSSALIDGPQQGWRAASILAGVSALALAFGLVVVILRLVSARRAADERARQAERLEAVGKLTGGVAHDFNNMLAIVIGSLDLARRRLASGNVDIVRHIDNAMDGAQRAADLTRRLLAFSRRQPLAPVAVDVNELVRSTGELLGGTLAANVEVRLDLSADVWPTFVDPGQLENALVNLAVNARDAMPDGGRLTISTRNEEDGPATRPGMVVLSVADTGTGMSPDTAARAFEPFFTTKEVGRGTGLGLSQIHGFAIQSGGDATIASEPGRGTKVNLLLPRYLGLERPALGAGGRTDQTAPPGRPEEIVLVVEDEEQVRRTNVEALRSLGYTVRHASDASEALNILDTQPGIRLMLTDIVMPGMNGRDLAERVARSHPDIRVLLATGFERDRVEADEGRILRKPFNVGELARRVRRELDFAA